MSELEMLERYNSKTNIRFETENEEPMIATDSLSRLIEPDELKRDFEAEQIEKSKQDKQLEEAEKALKSLTGSDSSMGEEQHINNIIANLSKMENLETLTDLDEREIISLTRLAWLSYRYNSHAGILLFTKLLQLKVSKNRGGRTELVQTLIGAFRMAIEKAQMKKVEV